MIANRVKGRIPAPMTRAASGLNLVERGLFHVLGVSRLIGMIHGMGGKVAGMNGVRVRMQGRGMISSQRNVSIHVRVCWLEDLLLLGVRHSEEVVLGGLRLE